MRSNYRRIGDFIHLVDERNSDLQVTLLLGLSISKEFIPSVANTVGTNMAKYKIIRKSQFACSIMQVRRDKKMPVALLKDYDEAIISQAYPVFEVKNPEELMPEYLMMWMSRSEFDREACFLAVGGVRGSLEWEDFLEMKLPIPPIEKQRAIVQEYNTIVNRIKLNEEINQKLEETAQAIYKHWFVDFEFPISKEYTEAVGKPELEGKPYKSSGGEMEYNDSLEKEVPKNWEVKPFTEVVSLKGGGTPSTNIQIYWNGNIPFFTPKDIAKSYYTTKTIKTLTPEGLANCSSKLFEKDTIFITARGTVGETSLASREMAMNQSCYAIVPNEKINPYFAHQLAKHVLNTLKNEAIGAVFKALVTRDFESKMVAEPHREILLGFGNALKPIYDKILILSQQSEKLKELIDLILARMTMLENEHIVT